MNTPGESTSVMDTAPVSPLVFVVAALRRRWMIMSMVLGAVTIVTAYTLIVGRTYTSTLIFMPQMSAGALSGIAGVAAQFGIAVPSGAPDQTPQFYAELIATGPFQEDLVNTQFSATVGMRADGKSDSIVTQSLIDWLGVDSGQSVGKRQTMAIYKLPKVLSVVPDVQTSMLTVTVTSQVADLSKTVADRILALVNQFNGTRRSTDAGTERRFVEGRLQIARDSLTANEDRVRRFLEQNRAYASSPMLTLDHDRLQREVDFEQQVVATLMQAVEQARITEVRNTPVVTVVESPEVALTPDRYRLLLKWVITTMATVLVGIVVIAAMVLLQLEEKHEPDVSSAFRGAWADTRDDIIRLVKPFRVAWQWIRRSRA